MITNNCVDQLVASRHFGERWVGIAARSGRFAETEWLRNGAVKTNAWRDRRWVVAAIKRSSFERIHLEQLSRDRVCPIEREHRHRRSGC